MNESQRLGLNVANGLIVLGAAVAFLSNNDQTIQIGFSAMMGSTAAVGLIYAGDVVASKFQQWRAKVETQELQEEVTQTLSLKGSLSDELLTKISNNRYHLGTAFEEHCTDKSALKAMDAWLNLAQLVTTDILLSDQPLSKAGEQLLQNETSTLKHTQFLALDLNYSKNELDASTEYSMP